MQCSITSPPVAWRSTGWSSIAASGPTCSGGPAHALMRLIRILDDAPKPAPVGAGEMITTGTFTHAWPIKPGERWTSDYGALGLDRLTITFS